MWPAGVVVVAGLAVGIVTQILQGVLPDGWGVLANSGVMWALLAFALGMVMPSPRWAAVGGAVELVIASIAYYMAVAWFEGNSSEVRSALVWSMAGIVAGSVFGLAGWCARRTEWRNAALALVSGVLIGEGSYLVWRVGDRSRPAGIVELAVAGIIAVVSLTRAPRATQRVPRAGVAALMVAAGVTTLVAMKAINTIFWIT